MTALDRERVVQLGACLVAQRDRPHHLAGQLVDLVGEAFRRQQRLYLSPEPQGQRSFRGKGFRPISHDRLSAAPPGGVERIGRSANYRGGEGIRTLDVNLGKGITAQ